MRLRKFISVLSFLALSTACIDEVFDPNLCMQASLGITVEFPAVPALKSTVDGEVPGSSAENTIHDLKIWVFTSDEKHKPVTSWTVNAADFPPAGGARRYTLHTSRAFAENPSLVDVFVLANGSSFGCELATADSWENVTNTQVVSSWNAVRNAMIDGIHFGVENPVHTSEAGLPMSAMALGQAVTGNDPFLTLNSLSLSRAVSKFRCVFSQMAASSQEATVSIDKITINGNQIPTREYVFSEDGGTAIVPGTSETPQYVSSSFELSGPGVNIPSSPAPERYRYVNQDAITYEALLAEGVARGELSHFEGDVTYFRESDLQLVGRIDYTVTKGKDVRPDHKDFYMAAAGDFARNHIWTLYAFFVRDMSLEIDVGVLPWDKQFYSIDFSEAAIQADPKFYVDENTAQLVEYNTADKCWDVYVNRSIPVVAYAPIKTPVGGKLWIKTSGQSNLFTITPGTQDYPFGTINPDTPIRITIGSSGDEGSGQITLKFVVETVDGREMSADSELIDKQYRFIIR